MINTHFRDMVEQLKNMSVICPPEELQAKPGEVSCDICLEPKLKALKTCLVCLTSYCQLHLEPHQRVSNLKKHTLTKPVPNLDDRVCKKHDKIFEFFCSVEKTCVCFMCLKEDHVAHETVPLELAFRKEKAHIERGIEEMKTRENVKTRSMNQIRSSVRQSDKNKDKDIADIGGVFTTLVDSLQKHKEDLVEVIELKHKEAVKNPEANVHRLLQEIIELKHKRSALEQLIKTEDCVQFFQRNPALLSASLTEDQLDSLPYSICSLTGYDHAGNEGYLNTVKTAAEHMEKILTNEMNILIKMVKHSVDKDTDSDTACYKEIWIPPKDKLMMIQQNDSVAVTLDSYTNSARISIFAEGKGLMYVPISVSLQHPFSLFNWRFENQPFALSVDGFSSGRFYYEVDVSEAKEWVLGVVRENVNRYMHYRSLPSPREGAWVIGTLCQWTGEYGYVSEYLQLKKVGVFVDYEKGEVSFYDVDARSLIYSYTECTFNEPVPFLKCFLYGLAGGSVSNRTKLYPVFGVFSEFSVLQITPAVDLF